MRSRRSAGSRPCGSASRCCCACLASVGGHSCAVCPERGGERHVGGPEAIARAHVQPDRRAAVGARAATGHAEQVVAPEVRRAVERAGHRLAGGGEERGGVPAHGAEAPGVEAGDVERAEAAHRGAADGHTPRVSVQPPQRGGDGLVHHVLRPAAAAAIVEEAAAAAARQQDRRGPRAQPGQGGKQPAAEQAVGRAAAPVQQHQQRAAARASARHHQRLLEAFGPRSGCAARRGALGPRACCDRRARSPRSRRTPP